MKENDDKFYKNATSGFDTFDNGEKLDEFDTDEGFDDVEELDASEDNFDESYEDEQYADEPYDDVADGYDDQYYDDRLSKVLDELADLKRGMPQTQQGYVTTQSGGNDVVMYNEISRLREELNKTQSTQNLHAELTRLKEDMDREKKTKEESFLVEIKRLNKKIAALTKEQAPALNSTNKARLGYSAENSEVSGADFSKLVTINESILRNAHESDVKMQNEITAIKSKIEAMPNFDELNRIIVNFRKGIKTLGEIPESCFGGELGDDIKSLQKKLEDLDNFFKKIVVNVDYNHDVSSSINDTIKNALDVTLNRENFDAFLAFSSKINEITFDIPNKDSVEKYTNIIDLVSYEDGEVLLGLMPEFMQVLKEILKPQSSFDYISVENKIKFKARELENEKNEHAKAKIYKSLAETFKEFEKIKINDIVSYSPICPQPIVNTLHFEQGEALFSKLDEIKSIINNLSLTMIAGNTPNVSQDVLASVNNLKDIVAKYQTALQDNANNFSKSNQTQQEFFANKINSLRIELLNALVSIKPKESPVVIDEINALKIKINDIIENNNSNNLNLLNGLSDIKEQVHFNELQESLSTVTSSEEEKQVLTKEIQELRERLTKISDDVAFVRGQIDANIEMPESTQTVVTEDLSSLAETIASIKEKLGALDEYDTVAEILSLREDVKASRIVDSNDVSSELESLRAEIASLKTELLDLKSITNEIAHTNLAVTNEVAATEGEATSAEINMLLGEIVSLRDEIQSYNDVKTVAEPENNNIVESAPKESESISIILDELTGIRSELLGYKEEKTATDITDIVEIKNEIAEIKNLIARRTTITDSNDTAASSNELNVVLDQIVDLKNEVDILKQQLAITADNKDEILSIKQMLQELVANSVAKNNAVIEKPLFSAEDYSNITDELTEIKDTINNNSLTAITADNNTVLEEILSLREDFEKFEETFAKNDNGYDLENSIETIKSDVGVLKNEPDLSIINEVLALREEFQEFKEELNKTRTSTANDSKNTELLAEVKSLRDQIFAISMANVNDSASNEVVYESYNNIILDEISAIRDDLAKFKESETAMNLSEELADLKKKIVNMVVDEKESYEEKFNKILSEIDKLKTTNSSDDNKVIFQALNDLKEELSNQHKAEASTEFGIIEEISKLKKELASGESDLKNNNNQEKPTKKQ